MTRLQRMVRQWRDSPEGIATGDTEAQNQFTASDLCKIVLAIFLPPLGVFLERGCNADFFINILLTILGYIPGIVHALYIIFKF